jgi:hypothetical protein
MVGEVGVAEVEDMVQQALGEGVVEGPHSQVGREEVVPEQVVVTQGVGEGEEEEGVGMRVLHAGK